MIDFFFLVPIAIGLGLAGLASFMWTLKNGQYDDLEGAAQRILFERDAATSSVGLLASESPDCQGRGPDGPRRGS
jgi:cbb3-type cytochrome oxidase maturation protein